MLATLLISFRLFIIGIEIEILRNRIDKEISESNIHLYPNSADIIKLQRKINSFRILERDFISQIKTRKRQY